MGCNCKTAKKIDERLNKDHYKYTKKGFRGKMYLLYELLMKLLNSLFLVVLIISLVPIVIGILITNMVFRGKKAIPFPKKLLKIKKDNEIEDNIEVIDGEEL